MATNTQLLTMIKAIQTRVGILEAWPASTDSAALITALQAADAALTARMDSIEAKECPQESRIDALESSASVLTADHDASV